MPRAEHAGRDGSDSHQRCEPGWTEGTGRQSCLLASDSVEGSRLGSAQHPVALLGPRGEEGPGHWAPQVSTQGAQGAHSAQATGEGPVSYFPLGAGQTPCSPQPRLPQSPLWLSEPLHPSPVGPESLRDLDQYRRKAQNSPTSTSVAGTVFTSLAKLPFLGGTFPWPTKSEPPRVPLRS